METIGPLSCGAIRYHHKPLLDKPENDPIHNRYPNASGSYATLRAGPSALGLDVPQLLLILVRRFVSIFGS